MSKKMSQLTFEEFLRDHHGAIYQGVDDDMADGYNQWLETLDGEEYIELGEQYGVMLRDSIND